MLGALGVPGALGVLCVPGMLCVLGVLGVIGVLDVLCALGAEDVFRPHSIIVYIPWRYVTSY